MKNKVYIVHGWGGSPDTDWFIWLKEKIEDLDWQVAIPKMPNTFVPTINEWVNYLNKAVKDLDENTYFVGHSIGCQAIMRYLEQIPENKKVGGAIFVAGWFNLSNNTWDDVFKEEIAKPWIETVIDFNKIKRHTTEFVTILSDNDPFVPLSDKDIFVEKLSSKVIIEHDKGHISGEDGSNDLPIVLESLMSISK